MFSPYPGGETVKPVELDSTLLIKNRLWGGKESEAEVTWPGPNLEGLCGCLVCGGCYPHLTPRCRRYSGVCTRSGRGSATLKEIIFPVPRSGTLGDEC